MSLFSKLITKFRGKNSQTKKGFNLKSLGFKKWPSKNQWRQFFKVLTKKEKIIFSIFLGLFLISFTFLSFSFYFQNTELKPAFGGVYTEGVVGFPRFINPIYGVTSDADRDLIEILFAGLMKYDENGKLVPDLAKTYKIKEEGKVYEFYLKENIFWQDGTPITARDVIFTIKAIQNPDCKSPLRASWIGIEVEKISERGITFQLKNPYSAFLENATLKIVPEHIWKEILPQNFPLAIYNLEPVGSGPYKLQELKQDKLGYIKSLTLTPNPYYFGKKPNIRQVNFLFFENEKELIEAALLGKVQGLSLTSLKDFEIKNTRWKKYSLSLPRYFAVFFNPDKSKVLAEKKVRLALNYGVNKKEIIEELFEGQAKIVDSPILPEIYEIDPPLKIYEFDFEKAGELLEEAGFVKGDLGKREKAIKQEPTFQFKSDLKLGSQGQEVRELQRCLSNPPAGGPGIYPEAQITGYFGKKTKEAVIRFQEKYAKDILEPWGFTKGTGLVSKTTRAKLNEVCFESPEKTLPLKFSLTTVSQPVLEEVANLLKNQWESLGAEVEIKTIDISQLEKEIIKPRNYEALLFGEALGLIPDPFPFWHSSQKKDPGLNLANFENKFADNLLKEARQTLNPEIRAEKLASFQDILIDEVPAVFLYNPDFIYLVSKEIKGINEKIIVDPSKRFSNIENWYIKTKRAWK